MTNFLLVMSCSSFKTDSSSAKVHMSACSTPYWHVHLWYAAEVVHFTQCCYWDSGYRWEKAELCYSWEWPVVDTCMPITAITSERIKLSNKLVLVKWLSFLSDGALSYANKCTRMTWIFWFIWLVKQTC